MREKAIGKKRSNFWLRMLPFIMWLLPVLALNVGFRFLARIEQSWKERELAETAQQELEALTRSSTAEYRLNRFGGQIIDKLTIAGNRLTDQAGWQQLQSSLFADIGQVFPDFKLHVFGRGVAKTEFEMLHAHSDKVESRRAMGMLFNHLVDQHKGRALPDSLKRQRDKIAENYFGVGISTDAVAGSMKGRTCNILHGRRPHWFVWDYYEKPDGTGYGYMMTAEVLEATRISALQAAAEECRGRGNGVGAFVPVLKFKDPVVGSDKLIRSGLFRSWREKEVRHLFYDRISWMENGPPAPATLGRYRIFSHLGLGMNHLSVFAARQPPAAPLPFWLEFLDMCTGFIWVLLVCRGLILNIWPEMSLNRRFLMLYFLAATFPLGFLGISAVAYHMQTERSARNQIADNLEGCLRLVESTRMQLQDDYQKVARRLFSDTKLAQLISQHGHASEVVKKYILAEFSSHDPALPLIGFMLLDNAGKGLEFASDAASKSRLKNIFGVYRSPIIENMRKLILKKKPDEKLPAFEVSDEEKFGSQAYSSLTGNNFSHEIEKRRNFCIGQKSGEMTAKLIYDLIEIADFPIAILFLLWDEGQLFEKSVSLAIEGFRRDFADFSFIAFRNTPQGLRILYRPENDDLAAQGFSVAARLAETAAARGGTVKNHLNGMTVVAMPYGQNSELIVAGIAGHHQIEHDSSMRRRTFEILIVISLLIAGLCARFVATLLLQPITALKTALDKVSQGDYNFDLTVAGKDELASLTGEFGKMVEGLQERERLSALLSDHAVEALAKNSETAGQIQSRSFRGIALVSDIRGFTTLCETHQTHEITEMLNHHFAAMSEVINGSGGRIYKFIGDAVEAIFEGPDGRVVALNAISAAVKMQKAMLEINQHRRNRGLFSYSSGVGLACGEFHAGHVGSDDTRLDYSIIGEAFAVAANNEAATKKCRDLPIAFSGDVAALIEPGIRVCKIDEEGEVFSLQPDQHQIRKINEEFAGLEMLRVIDNSASAVDVPETAVMHKKTDWNRFFLVFAVAVFAIFMTVGIFYGFEWRRQRKNEVVRHQAEQKIARLARQLRSDSAGYVAFETVMNSCLKRAQSRLAFEPSENDAELMRGEVDRTFAGLSRAGFRPTRVVGISLEPGLNGAAGIFYKHGLTENQEKQFFLLARYLSLVYQKIDAKFLRGSIDPFLSELFGSSESAEFLTSEKIGFAGLTLNGQKLEAVYWNYMKVFPAHLAGAALPERNPDLFFYKHDLARVAGVVIVTVPVEQLRDNPSMLAEAYSDSDIKIAVKTSAGMEYSNELFNASSTNQLLHSEKIVVGGRPCEFLLASSLDEDYGSQRRNQILALFAATILIIWFAVKTFLGGSFVNRSIRAQILLSILMTALVPLTTVFFVAQIFVFENHQALLHQQRTELKRFLDEFELRQGYYQQVVIWQLERYSKNRTAVELAGRSDKEMRSSDFVADFNRYFAEVFKAINLVGDWSSNATVRDVILVNHTENEMAYRENKSKDEFSGLLGQLIRFLLKNLSAQAGVSGLQMQNVKGELFFDAAMKNVRSNFGDEAYLRLNAAHGMPVEFAITTGAAVMLSFVLPSIFQPESALTWMVTLNGGGYMTRIAKRNQSPWAVFTLEYHSYGCIEDQFVPWPGLRLDKAAGWINASSLPISFEQKVGDEVVTLEGRPGIRQFHNFMVGAAMQRPVAEETRKISLFSHYLLAMAVLLFVLIGLQTATDITVPVQALAEGMRQIGLENYAFRIGLDREDELGQLCRSYDRFARSLAEKETMGKMLSRSARQAVSSGDGLAGAWREFVFIFCGSLDFTARLSSEGTGHLFKMLKEQVAMICRIILEEGGDIDKLIGDKVLGVFPIEDGRAVEARQSAIRAAERIVAAENSGSLNFSMATGVNAGRVISGMLGFGSKRDFTVIGDAVNVSARIQKEAEKLPDSRCLYSERFVKGLPDASAFVLHGETALKGKAEKARLFRKI